MTKFQALYQFFSGYDIPAYEENSIYSGTTSPEMPYLTYEVRVGDFDTITASSFSIWYHENSWKNAYNKAEEIRKDIKYGKTIPYENGCLIVSPASPFYQGIGNDTDELTKQIYFNVNFEFIDID